MAAHVGHGGQDGAHATQGPKGGMARCRERAGDGPGGAGEAAGRQQQGLWHVRPHVHHWYPSPGAEAGQPRVHVGQAVGGGAGPQQGYGAHRASAVANGVARRGAGCPKAPRSPLEVADIPHRVGLPEARMWHAVLCMAAAEGGMSMVMLVSLQHMKDAMQEQRLYVPQPWEEKARRWLHVEGVPPTHTVGEAHMGKLVVSEGAEYWVCIRVGKCGCGVGCGYREPAQEAAVQGPGLLQGA